MAKKKQKHKEAKAIETIHHLSQLLKLTDIIHHGSAFTPDAVNILNGIEVKYFLTQKLADELEKKNEALADDIKIPKDKIDSIKEFKKFSPPDDYKFKETKKFDSPEFPKEAKHFLLGLHHIIDKCDCLTPKEEQTKPAREERKQEEQKKGKQEEEKEGEEEQEEEEEDKSYTISIRTVTLFFPPCHFHQCHELQCSEQFDYDICLEKLRSLVKNNLHSDPKLDIEFKKMLLITSKNDSIKLELRNRFKQFAIDTYFNQINLNHFKLTKFFWQCMYGLMFLWLSLNIVDGHNADNNPWKSRFYSVPALATTIICLLFTCWFLKTKHDYDFFAALFKNNRELVLKTTRCLSILIFLSEKGQEGCADLPENVRKFYAFFKKDINSGCSYLQNTVNQLDNTLRTDDAATKAHCL